MAPERLKFFSPPKELRRLAESTPPSASVPRGNAGNRSATTSSPSRSPSPESQPHQAAAASPASHCAGLRFLFVEQGLARSSKVPAPWPSPPLPERLQDPSAPPRRGSGHQDSPAPLLPSSCCSVPCFTNEETSASPALTPSSTAPAWTSSSRPDSLHRSSRPSLLCPSPAPSRPKCRGEKPSPLDFRPSVFFSLHCDF